MIKQIYIIATLFLIGVGVQAQPTILFNNSIEGELIAGQMYIYEDETSFATYSDIAELKNGFIPNIQAVPQYFLTPSAIWLKANIRVEKDEPIYLEICYPMMDSVELFVVGAKGQVIHHKAIGSAIPIGERNLQENNIKFLLKKGLYTYYIRAKSTYTLRLPIKLVSYKTAYKEGLHEKIFHGMYLGLTILIVLYALFLWIAFRDKVYAFYALYIFAMVIKAMYFLGYAYLLLWANNSWINHYEPSILGMVFFSILFAIVFLETGTKFKALHRWLWAVLLVNMLVFPVDWLGYHAIASKMVQFIDFVAGISMLVGGIISYRSGFKPARFFLLAWAVFLVGLSITMLQKMGALPYTYFFVQASQIGAMIGAVLLSFALGDRMNIRKHETEKTKKEKYKRIAESEDFVRQKNALLSRKVEERSREMEEQTQILGQQKEELEDLNTTKDKILSVIAHDLRGPLSNVSQLANMMSEDEKLRNKETIELLKDASKRSFDLLDSLLHWAKAQFGDAEYNLSKVSFYDLADDTIQLYGLKAKAKEISIINNIPQKIYANADTDMINTVIRNLISNALKFTIVGGEIVLGGSIDEKKDTVSLWISDSGLGISEDKIETIFDAGKNKSLKGTDGETGTGLGLVICKDFVEKNNGTITVISKLGQGSKFTITLPVFK